MRSKKNLNFIEKIPIKYLCLILLLASSIIYMSNIREVMDISFYDEAQQLKDGLSMGSKTLPPADRSPIYSLWYAFLSLFISSPVEIYYFNWYFLTVCVPAMMYITLTTIKLNPLFSFLISMVFLYSRFNYPLWPKTNNFGILLILIIVLLLSKYKNISMNKKRDLYLFLFYIGSYLRPELLISCLVYFLINLFKFKLKFTITRWIYISTVALFLFLFGIPFTNRLSVAFGQHFAVNYIDKNGIPIVAWDSYRTIIDEVFGKDRNNIIEYFFSNPKAFLDHVIFNIKRVPVSFLSYFKPYNESGYYIFVVLVGFLLVLLIVANYHKENLLKRFFNLSKIRNALKKNTNQVLLSLIAPFVITTSLIFPRGHYFLYIFIGLTIIFVYNLKDLINPTFYKLNKYFKIGFLLLIFSITHVNTQEKNNLYGLEIVNFITEYKNFYNLDTINIFSGDGNYCVYVPDICELNPNLGDSEDYTDYIEKNEIHIIILSERLLISYGVLNQKGSESFVQDLEKLSYLKKKSIWGTDIYVKDY